MEPPPSKPPKAATPKVVDPSKYEQGKHEQGKHEQGKYEQGKYEQGKYEQGKYEQGKSEPKVESTKASKQIAPIPDIEVPPKHTSTSNKPDTNIPSKFVPLPIKPEPVVQPKTPTSSIKPESGVSGKIPSMSVKPLEPAVQTNLQPRRTIQGTEDLRVSLDKLKPKKEPIAEEEDKDNVSLQKSNWKNPYAIWSESVNSIIKSCNLTFFYVVQCVSLNFYIFRHFQMLFIVFLFTVGDLLCFTFFVHTIMKSNLYMHMYTKDMTEEQFVPSQKKTTTIQELKDSSSYRQFYYKENNHKEASVMPFIYISWICYVSVLSAKISIIYKSSLTDILNTYNVFFGGQTLKMTIGLSSLIFLFLAEGHNWEHLEHPRNRYTKALCAQTIMDIFDTVSLLSMITDTPNIRRHTRVVENLIITLANVNLLLPAMKLHKLSMVHMDTTRSDLIILIVHSLSYVILINGSFLLIRIYIWFHNGEDPSIYLMKNVISIILTLWQVYPMLVLLKRDRVANVV